VEQLWQQLAETDVVVATRFHNVLLALMLGKPVLALAYHEKVTSLMASVGLARHCHPVSPLDPETLLGRFEAVEAEAPAIERSLVAKAAQNRMSLEEQYGRIFGGL
jgi:polysaccharide pyruvyl transferase WcaK-like protein